MSVISCTQGIREEIASRLNEVETDSAGTSNNSDIYTNWINLAVRDLVQSFPNAPFVQTSADRTLSAGTKVYPALISNVEKINTITNPSNQVKLTYISPEEFDMLNPSATGGGSPTTFTIRGLASTGWFEFYPVPGSTPTLHFTYDAQMPTVSAGSSQPQIPTKYYDLLVLYGEKMGWRRRMRYDLVQTVDAEYERGKQRMIQDLMRQTDQAGVIRNVRDFTQGGGSKFNDPISNEFFGTPGNP